MSKPFEEDEFGEAQTVKTPKSFFSEEYESSSLRKNKTRMCISCNNERVFLIGGCEVSFGKDKKTKNLFVDIPIRILPCRSPSLDAHNWKKTMEISHHHADFRLSNGVFQVKDRSTNGIYLQSSEDNFENFSVSDVEGTFQEKEGVCLNKNDMQTRIPPMTWTSLHDHTKLSFGKNILGFQINVLKDPSGVLAVGYRRLGNMSNYSYIQVCRSVVLRASRQGGMDWQESGDGIVVENDNGLFRCHTRGDYRFVSYDKNEIVFGGDDGDKEAVHVAAGNLLLSVECASDEMFVTDV